MLSVLTGNPVVLDVYRLLKLRVVVPYDVGENGNADMKLLGAVGERQSHEQEHYGVDRTYYQIGRLISTR